jgi:hypothetical protein
MPSVERLPLVIFTGGLADSEPERWVSLACRANTVDLVERALQVPTLHPIIVVTPASDWSAEVARLPVEMAPDLPGEAFHFGRQLREVASRYRLPRLLYVGGGAGALLTAPELAALARRALELERGVLANNLYSADLVALAPASTLYSVDLPASDNDLAWRLAATGLPADSLPATAATRLDLDTPNELAIAALHPACGPNLRRLVAGLPLDLDRLRQVLAELHSARGEVLLYGRISSATWSQIERLPCQTRVFSEERGMRASGRLECGQVQAWIGAFLDCAGPCGLFESLARACTAAILDTRVLFAHRRLSPTAADRFYSDLLQPAEIVDPEVRALTEAALAAPVPLLMGGQALVSGGLLALAEMAPESAAA